MHVSVMPVESIDLLRVRPDGIYLGATAGPGGRRWGRLPVSVVPVESIDLLRVRPDGIYLDATAGLGGHTGLIARQLTTGAVIANDHDTKSLEMARANTAAWADRICF